MTVAAVSSVSPSAAVTKERVMARLFLIEVEDDLAVIPDERSYTVSINPVIPGLPLTISIDNNATRSKIIGAYRLVHGFEQQLLEELAKADPSRKSKILSPS